MMSTFQKQDRSAQSMINRAWKLYSAMLTLQNVLSSIQYKSSKSIEIKYNLKLMM